MHLLQNFLYAEENYYMRKLNVDALIATLNISL